MTSSGQSDAPSTSAVVTVGNGRGFVMEGGRDLPGRVIVTDAHCLPFLPPPHGASYIEERTYQNLVGPLGQEPTVWAECLFVDPVADVALLGTPDSQSLFDQSDAWNAFVEACDVFRLGRPPVYDFADPIHLNAYVLSLDNVWLPCRVKPGKGLFVLDVPIVGGMSGSPIVIDGEAVGLVSLAHGNEADVERGHGPQLRIEWHLPVWIVRSLISGAARNEPEPIGDVAIRLPDGRVVPSESVTQTFDALSREAHARWRRGTFEVVKPPSDGESES